MTKLHAVLKRIRTKDVALRQASKAPMSPAARMRKRASEVRAAAMPRVKHVPLDLLLETCGCGIWSDYRTIVRVTGMRLLVGDGGDHGDLRVRFDTKTWNTRKHGLIYSDSTFQKHLKRALVSRMGLSEKAIRPLTYSEQGMQGENEVSLDVGKAFVEEWLRKYGEQQAPKRWSFEALASKTSRPSRPKPPAKPPAKPGGT